MSKEATLTSFTFLSCFAYHIWGDGNQTIFHNHTPQSAQMILAQAKASLALSRLVTVPQFVETPCYPRKMKSVSLFLVDGSFVENNGNPKTGKTFSQSAEEAEVQGIREALNAAEGNDCKHLLLGADVLV